MEMSQKKQVLLNNARDKQKLSKIRKRLKSPDGGLFEGYVPNDEWSQNFLGDTFHKLILASSGIEKYYTAVEKTTALGGWCAVRTKGIKDISTGVLDSPIQNKSNQFENIADLTSWLKVAVSADQIVEAVGIFRGNNYAAISEEKLWTEKVVAAAENYFKRSLDDKEKSEISDAVTIAEKLRYNITKKYIEYVSGAPIKFTQFKDTDIFDELLEGRDKVIASVSLTIDDLSNAILTNRLKSYGVLDEPDLEKIHSDLNKFIDRSSLVWFMYTGEYVRLLQKKQILSTDKAIIIEPWSHGSSNEAEALFNFHVFGKNNGENNYLRRGGINENVGFVSIDEVSQYNLRKSKSFTHLSRVPNLQNYTHYVSNFTDLDSLNLMENQAFMSGVNFLPYGKNLHLLKEMITLRDEYRSRRQNYKSLGKNSTHLYTALRNEYAELMRSLGLKVSSEINSMLYAIFT